MNMTDWAKREIEIACARERGEVFWIGRRC